MDTHAIYVVEYFDYLAFEGSASVCSGYFTDRDQALAWARNLLSEDSDNIVEEIENGVIAYYDNRDGTKGDPIVSYVVTAIEPQKGD